MKMRLRDEILSRGAAACGVVSRARLSPCMTEAQAVQLEARVPGWQSVVCGAFPYYAAAPAPRRAISRYAWGLDYHRVLTDALTPAAELLRETGAQAEILVDASPIPERAAAALAGIGVLGRHGLVLVPEYGSYVFLGTIATTLSLPEDGGEIRFCEDCGACRMACPTGALSGAGYEMERCLSHISQKKGELSVWEAEALRAQDCVWGCDVCQTACPHNENPRETAIPAFREGMIQTITREMLDGQTNRSFRETYGHRAFSWRGPEALRRNLRILDEKDGNREENN